MSIHRQCDTYGNWIGKYDRRTDAIVAMKKEDNEEIDVVYKMLMKTGVPIASPEFRNAVKQIADKFIRGIWMRMPTTEERKMWVLEKKSCPN